MTFLGGNARGDLAEIVALFPMFPLLSDFSDFLDVRLRR